LKSSKWCIGKLIIVDEYHEFKNKNSKGWESLNSLKIACGRRCSVIGLTGTAMQNDHQELWNLVHLCQPGLLGEWKDFRNNTVRTLKLARTKDAKRDVLELCAKRQEELADALKHVYLSRKKVDVLRNTLTEKDEKVIFCELSYIQKTIYRRIINLPDFFLLRMANQPCDCGINRAYFARYKHLKTRKEQINYQRRHKKEIIKRKDCCHSIPLNPNRNEPGQPWIDPDAALWKSFHPNDKACDTTNCDNAANEFKKQSCPGCIQLPALQMLYKLCSHASLLQLDIDPCSLEVGSEDRKKAERKLAFAKVALGSSGILDRLPGGSYVREDGIMDDHTSLSGKMKNLDFCLNKYHRKRDRVLIFSHSTTTLSLIQHYVKSKGYSHLILSGQTATKKRQTLVDKYQNDNSIFVFLISTKAGGLGLNLTAANKVIIYDVCWNPSHDEQAQDRAFRIGQKRDVEVVRLVARGTVEELMYARQIYKVHLSKQTLSSDVNQPARIFRGVAGNKERKGELFGLENLLKFKDGSFMADMWASAETTNSNKAEVKDDKTRPLIQNRSQLQSALANMTTDQVEHLSIGDTDILEGSIHRTDQTCPIRCSKEVDDERNGTSDEIKVSAVHHTDFLRADKGGALLQEGDEGFEEEMGGESQLLHVTSAFHCIHSTSQTEQSDLFDVSVKAGKDNNTEKDVSDNLRLQHQQTSTRSIEMQTANVEIALNEPLTKPLSFTKAATPYLNSQSTSEILVRRQILMRDKNISESDVDRNIEHEKCLSTEDEASKERESNLYYDELKAPPVKTLKRNQVIRTKDQSIISKSNFTIMGLNSNQLTAVNTYLPLYVPSYNKREETERKA